MSTVKCQQSNVHSQMSIVKCPQSNVHSQMFIVKCPQSNVQHLQTLIFKVFSANVILLGIKCPGVLASNENEPNIKAYVCNICGAYSTSIHYLKTHKQAVHFNIAKSKCENCGKCFINKNNLVIHLKKAHGIGQSLPSFPCGKCGSTLATSSALKRQGVCYNSF